MKSTMIGGISVSSRLKDLNKQRRIRRMRRVVIKAADAARVELDRRGARYFACLVTLTYRNEVSWEASQIRHYIRNTVQRAQKSGVRLRYQWVIELTQAGRPHYHVVWWVPHGYRLRKPDEVGGWTHGMSNIKRARRPVGYLVKYATKGQTAVSKLPKGARLFGCGGGEEHEKLAIHRAGLPMWLERDLPSDERGRKIARVGWTSLHTGAIYKSPFKFEWMKDPWGVVVVVITKTENFYHGFEDSNRRHDGEFAGDPSEWGPGGIRDPFTVWAIKGWQADHALQSALEQRADPVCDWRVFH